MGPATIGLAYMYTISFLVLAPGQVNETTLQTSIFKLRKKVKIFSVCLLVDELV